MKELIKITEKLDIRAVSARDLYAYLEPTERFSKWIERQFKYGFEESEDYIGCEEFNTLANQVLIDYALTVDTAKEISMLQKSEKGKAARKYFIACEKALKEIAPPSYQIEDSATRARIWADEQEATKKIIDEQALQLSSIAEIVKKNAPKVALAEAISTTKNSVLVRQFAKDISTKELVIGQKRAFEWFRYKGYMLRNNEPAQRSVDQGLMEVIVYEVKGYNNPVTKITGKGIVYFSDKIKDFYTKYVNVEEAAKREIGTARLDIELVPDNKVEEIEVFIEEYDDDFWDD